MNKQKTKPYAEARKTLRAKLVRTMVATLAIVAAAVLVTLAALSYWTARDTLSLVEDKIRESIFRKGQGLTTNHALALRGLVADNAFGDVRRLVEGSVAEDSEVVYGVFVGADLKPWAYVSPTSGGQAKPQPWVDLGLYAAQLRRPKPHAERRVVFGKDVYQFSAPVLGDDHAQLGTIIYGVSGEPVLRALEKARTDSRRSLATAVALLGLLALLTVFLGVLLVRRAAARITRPLAELTSAATAIASGTRDQRVTIRSGDEIEVLGDAFNSMVADLGESYARLETLNRTLEERVAERTRELAARNQDLRLVLDTVNEGLLTISRDGTLAQERSSMIDAWFGPYTTPMRFVDYIAAVDREVAEAFELGHEALLEGVLPRELCLAQLPSRLSSGEREYRCSYLPIGEENDHRGLLLVIEDVTEQLALAQHEAEQRELLAMFQTFSRDRSGFLAFFDEASELLEQVSSGTSDLQSQRRLIHTLKGNASLLGLDVIAQLCHKAEDEMEELKRVHVTPSVTALRSRWLTLTQTLRAFLGERGRDVLEVDVRDLDLLAEDVGRGASAVALLQRIASWRNEPVERPLARLARHGRALARRLGKGDVTVEIEAERVRLDPRRWGALWAELVHVVRNAVDHGLETPDERRAAGKPASPRLRLAAGMRGHEFVIEIEDDGRGIDWGAVRERASARGLPAGTESDLLRALFTGLSTREEVSATSGRGIGLSAVYRRVREFQGTAAVVSRAGGGAGTCWRFSFPLTAVTPIEDESTRAPRAAGTAVA